MGNAARGVLYQAGPVRVKQRGSRYRVMWSEGGTTRERSATSLPDACQLADREAARIEAGGADQSRTTVADVVAAYLQSPQVLRRRRATISQRRSLLQVHVVPEPHQCYDLDGRPLGPKPTLAGVLALQVTPAQLAAVGVMMHRQGYPLATIEHVVAAMRMLVRWGAGRGAFTDPGVLVEEGCVVPQAAIDADQRARLDSDDDLDVHVPPAADVEALAEALAARRPQYGTLCRLTAVTGLRWSETAALTWANVNLSARKVRVRRTAEEQDGVVEIGETKSKHSVRWVPILSERVVGELQAMWDASDQDPKALVFTAPAGGVLRRSNFRNRFLLPALQDAGITGRLHWHDLRHYAISSWVESRQIPLAKVSKWAGHHKVSFTLDTYYGSRDDELEQLIQRLGETWDGM